MTFLQTPPWMRRLCPNRADEPPTTCQSCGWPPVVTADDLPEDGGATLSYDAEQEDEVLREIVNMSEPAAAGPKLTAAFLFSLCIRRSAAARDLDRFRRLLLNIAARVQEVVWVHNFFTNHLHFFFNTQPNFSFTQLHSSSTKLALFTA